jgi:internalin A
VPAWHEANGSWRADDTSMPRPGRLGKRAEPRPTHDTLNPVDRTHFQPEVGMPDEPKPVSRPWRRLRISVRGLIVVVLLVGGWFGWIVHCARIQREAVSAIEQAGGSVKYDWEWSNGNSIPGGKPWAPRLLVDLIGVDYFGHVTAVGFFQLGQTKQSGLNLLNDTVIVQVGRLTEVERLDLYESPITEAGVGDRVANVTDAGLVGLKGLTNLSALNLTGANITYTGLLHLKGLTRLSSIDLSETKITDAGLVHLKALTNLKSVGVRRTQVTDAGLVHLKALTNLSLVNVIRSHVTVAGIKDLKQAFPRLQVFGGR